MKKLIPLAIIAIASCNYLQAQTPVTTTITGSVKITDSLNVINSIKSSSSISAAGAITATGEVIAKDTMRALKDILVDGNIIVDGKFNVAGQSTFGQELIIKKSLLFDAGNEFSFIPATSTTKAMFYLGSSAAKPLPLIQCPNPNINILPQFLNNGSFISRVSLGTSGAGLTNSSLSMYSAPWDGSGVIEVEGVDKNGLDNNGLLINYFCGRNTYINTNTSLSNMGGTVFMGKKVAMGQSAKIGYSSNPLDLNTALDVYQNSTTAIAGIKINTYNNSLKALTISNSNFASSPFIVYGDGKTQIGIGKPKVGGVAANAMLSVDGLILAKEVRVAISTATHWADYVFDNNYKLISLLEVEKFIKKHKHLPEVPSADEVVKNGVDVNKMSATLLKKIEELTLYTIELKKQLESQQQEINSLKK